MICKPLLKILSMLIKSVLVIYGGDYIKIIIVYDAGEKRNVKLLKLLRKYLNWVQNSVFEGELTISEVKEIKTNIKELISKKDDMVIIYSFAENFDYKRTVIGTDKNTEKAIL